MAGQEARTERAQFVFVVKEYADGTPWIMLEPVGGNLPDIGNSFLGFEIRGVGNDQSAMKRAKQIADDLNDDIECVTHTVFDESGR